MALQIRLATPDDWRTVRDVRLAALQEAPYAFGSTYERERDRDEAGWRDWIGREASQIGCVFLAFSGDRAVGMDGAFLEDDGAAHLIAMWVDPSARGQGVGSALTRAVVDWSRQIGAPATVLDVAEDNLAAMALYEQMGFVRTGASQPLHSNPSRTTFEMRRENG